MLSLALAASTLGSSLGSGLLLGLLGWVVLRVVLPGFYTVDQSERAVLTTFGRARRLPGPTTADLPIAEALRPDERERYRYPQVQVIGPGGPYFRWPWQSVHKVSVAVQTMNMALDPEDPGANHGGSVLEAVTKDQLNTGLTGDVRFRVSEQNLYAYLFAIKRPIAHVMGYFVSVLRQKIASFEAPQHALGQAENGAALDLAQAEGISINDLRKNLRDINQHMDLECRSSEARYGVALDASLITSIDPPSEVESALAAINTAHNHVSSDISLARATADQRIVQSRRAVEIETLRAQAEVQPLQALATELELLQANGPDALRAYRRFVALELLGRAQQHVREVRS
ncbi:MAG: SPFH domain-containing protein [Proteobacteria bacterium]|nr:SPFH domain-containing protein [Pseudomonadota bacterium]